MEIAEIRPRTASRHIAEKSDATSSGNHRCEEVIEPRSGWLLSPYMEGKVEAITRRVSS